MAYDDMYIGRLIGNYRILKEIARGGFGKVYLARHQFLHERSAVIKLLHQMYLGSQQDQDAFMREAQFLEKLKRPNILPVIDVGLDNGQPIVLLFWLLAMIAAFRGKYSKLPLISVAAQRSAHKRPM